MNSILSGCHLHCVDKSHSNPYIEKIIKDVPLPKYERTYTCFTLINEREESSQVSSIVSNNEPGHVEKLSFKPLPPKDKKKRERRRRGVKRERKRYPLLSMLLLS